MPAAWKASILLLAVPKVPDTIAPAWPQRLPRRGIAAADKGHDRDPRHVLGDKRRGIFFVGAADFAADHDRARLRVVGELAQAVDEGGADNRVAADAHAGRLSQTARVNPSTTS